MAIFNNCINKSIWPNALKIAEIIPVRNTGTKQNPNVYRSISLICHIAKIFGKIIHKRILHFVNKRKADIKQYLSKKISSNEALNIIRKEIMLFGLFLGVPSYIDSA